LKEDKGENLKKKLIKVEMYKLKKIEEKKMEIHSQFIKHVFKISKYFIDIKISMKSLNFKQKITKDNKKDDK
jgi:hypothetical protein